MSFYILWDILTTSLLTLQIEEDFEYPHRFPFLLWIACRFGRKVVSARSKNLSLSMATILRGHFTEARIFPGV